MKSVWVGGAFDQLNTRDFRFLEEAARFGPLTVVLSADASAPGRFPFQERRYFLQALRFVTRVVSSEDRLDISAPGVWVEPAGAVDHAREKFCAEHGLEFITLPEPATDFPIPPSAPSATGRKKVVVTGCYDWLHSGHVRFFEEVSGYGDLYAIVGNDKTIAQLKGPGHPLLPQAERRHLVGAIRFVKQSLISSGSGWLDADPEIQQLRPDIYAVNEDGDKGGKREYCEKWGIEYLVLRRTPAPGLPRRSSTELRGF
ncbi:MAG TPA: adenylyltransferase/cytidyltransferase family protein [Verrucomicrobiae bacterium]|jgi:cytidyltransferase-like protein|nr:adenylyltransferase/cytidyltransferase family protein [Verrucomicrobiae bacterium]